MVAQISAVQYVSSGVGINIHPAPKVLSLSGYRLSRGCQGRIVQKDVQN